MKRNEMDYRTEEDTGLLVVKRKRETEEKVE